MGWDGGSLISRKGILIVGCGSLRFLQVKFSFLKFEGLILYLSGIFQLFDFIFRKLVTFLVFQF